METASLKSFATWARTALIREVTARIAIVLAPGSPERVEQPKVVAALENAVRASGGGENGRSAVADRVAYTWFNRIIALRFMDANGYTGIGIVSPQAGTGIGQPEILAEAKRANLDPEVLSRRAIETVKGLLNGTRRSPDPQGEAYALLLAEYCRHWNRSMPFMFEREGDFTELLIPANLLADESVLNRASKVLTAEVCQDVEVIGWLYQFYISERKDEVFASFKKNKKAGAEEIPAATQLFTPHWIVRYLVENSLGRLWMLNRPSSRLVDQMDYYIAPVDEESDFLKITKPEELRVIDPACGSGHMLTYAFDVLYAIYEEEGYSPAEIPRAILTNNLYGTEIDPRAGALAAFALTMKARAKQRTFFNNQIEPNVCVIEPISFGTAEIDFLLTGDGDSDAEVAFWNQYAKADLLGSLIRTDDQVADRLARHLGTLDDSGDLLIFDLLERANRVLRQAKFLAPNYAVVVANPPYMGAKNMTESMALFAKEYFPNSKADLFSMFIERCFDLVVRSGIAALVTMQSWMFLPTFAQLRGSLSQRASVLTLAHLENMVMGIAFGTSATVWKVGDRTLRGVFFYVRLADTNKGAPTSFPPDNERNRGALGHQYPGIFVLDNAAFREIPGGPIAYWVSLRIREIFGTASRLDSVAEPRQGMATSDNARFLRYAYEVSRGRVSFASTSRECAAASGAKWFPYSKGGERRKWYGNHDLVVNWEDDGTELLDFASSLYGSASRTIKNTRYYFRQALNWTLISSGGFAARYRPPGFIFDVNGMSSFADRGLEEILGTVNSSVGEAMLAVINPTMALQVGDLKAFPFIAPENAADLVDIVKDCVDISRTDWDSQETSWDFSTNGLIAFGKGGQTVASALKAHWSYWDAQVARLKGLEERINVLCAKTYGLRGEVREVVDIAELNLVNNRAIRSGADGGEARGLVSFAVGCMFGRYSLDEPGLILADQGAALQDYMAKVPFPTFTPDADNVIPIVDGDWFEDDIVARFRQFLRAAFGDEHFEENLRFVTETLEVKDLRDYFVKSFYKDHVQRYKKRPIYWLFSSPKGSFNALIYMHRYTPSTVSTVLNEYLREYIAKLGSSLQHHERLAAGGGTPRELAAAQKEVDRLRKVLLELHDYEHDVIYPLASQQITIELDDGVKVNYPKFGAALKKIPGLDVAE